MIRRSTRRGFTLAELIMAVALLALFSVFIVQLFYKADTLARKARNLDQAVAVASNIADQWRTDSDAEVPAAIVDLRQNPTNGKTTTIDLDSHFQISTPENALYQAVLTLQDDITAVTDTPERTPVTGLWKLSIVIIKAGPTDSPPIYALTTSRYTAGEVGQ